MVAGESGEAPESRERRRKGTPGTKDRSSQGPCKREEKKGANFDEKERKEKT